MNPAARRETRPQNRRVPPGGAPHRRRARSRHAGEPRPAPPPIPVLIDRILRSEKFGDSVVHVTSVPAQPAAFRDLERPLPEPLRRACTELGIERFFSHQAEAIDAIRSGGDVLTVTPTASGKSLVYLLPTMEAALTRPGARALYLFPYKALAQDQLQGIREMATAAARHGGIVPGHGDLPGTGRPVSAAIYDGDTPNSQRRRIKADPPDILITNPDMLHLGILPHHEDWRVFFSNLEMVVLDEMHVYKGIFGTHLHHIMRRLLRIAARHGSRPRFVASSATVANPGRLGEALIGRPFKVVERSGAPRAAKYLMFLNPRTSPYTAATNLLAWALDDGYRAIAFTKARKITELLYSWLLQAAPRHRGHVSAYRSGYLPEERREIEKHLFEGSLQGVIATSALELGVDIGGLDVCILVGYPGSIVSSWQRIGRVGREDRSSLTILVALPDALDQYFMKHPDEFLNRGFEEVVFDPANPIITRGHLICAAAETPLEDPADREFYDDATFEQIDAMERDATLARDASERRWFSLRRRPQRDVNLRSIGYNYTIVDDDGGRVIGTIDGTRAFHETHTGAVYLHHGQQYLVRELDADKRRIRVVAVDVEYYTEIRSEKETEILETLESRVIGPFEASLGRLKVREELTGYEKRRLLGRDRLGLYPLSLPPLIFETVGLWIRLPDVLREMVLQTEGHFMGGIHAVEHAMISLFPLLAICDRGDIGGISYPMHAQIGGSAIFIYDGHPGGVGLSAKGFERLEDLLNKTADLLASCPCEIGCPSCVHSPKCGNGNNPLDKRAARLILDALTGRQPLPPIARGGEQRPAPQTSPGPAPAAPVRSDFAVPVPVDPAPPAPAYPPAAPRPALRVMGRGEDSEPLPSPGSRGGRGRAPNREQTLFFDLETQKSAEEVGGWKNISEMKLALAVTYNDTTSQFRTYREEDVDRLLLDLVMANRVIGYNIDRFDLVVLKGYTDWDLSRVRTFDMLTDIYRKLGFRLKLTDLAATTLGIGKSADGLQSLKWWKEGRADLVEEYCRRDVEVTRNLYQFGVANGYLLYPDREGRSIRLPLEWK